MKEFERDIQPPGMSKTDVDIITQSDDLIEVKSGVEFKTANKQSDEYSDLAEKLSKYNKYRDEKGLGDVEVHFTEQPHNDIVNIIKRKGAKCRLYVNGKWRSC